MIWYKIKSKQIAKIENKTKKESRNSPGLPIAQHCSGPAAVQPTRGKVVSNLAPTSKPVLARPSATSCFAVARPRPFSPRQRDALVLILSLP